MGWGVSHSAEKGGETTQVVYRSLNTDTLCINNISVSSHSPSIHPSIHTSIHIFCNATSIHSLSPLPLHARACVCVCVCHTQVVVAATVVVVVIIGMRNGSRPTEALATPLSISKSCSKQASKQANKQTHMDANSFAGVAGSYFIRTAFGVPFWVKENW